MRRIRFFTLIVITIPIILSRVFPFCAYATIEDELPLTAVNEADSTRLWSYYSLHEDDFVHDGETIDSFDVSEKMGIALITSGHHLLHMDYSGRIIASFSFNCSGTVGVVWDNDDICLLFTRNSIVMKVDSNGVLKEFFQLNDLNYKTQKTWKTLGFRTQKEVGSGSYLISRQKGIVHALFGEGYTKLVFREKSSGNEQVLYDVSKKSSWDIALKIFIGIIAVAIVLAVVRYHNKTTRNSDDQR